MAKVDDVSKNSNSGLTSPVPLTKEHDLSDFDCGEQVLNEWLIKRALGNEGKASRTYVVSENSKVVAYYCIATGAVERVDAPGKIRRNAPDTIPIAIIGRLAVNKGHSGRGLGADLLSDAMRRIALISQEIGISAIVVHAKSAAAKQFYMKCAEFIEYPEDSRTLFLPLETVIAAFSQA